MAAVDFAACFRRVKGVRPAVGADAHRQAVFAKHLFQRRKGRGRALRPKVRAKLKAALRASLSLHRARATPVARALVSSDANLDPDHGNAAFGRSLGERVAAFAINEEGVACDALMHEANLLVERDRGRAVGPNLEFDPDQPPPESLTHRGIEESQANTPRPRRAATTPISCAGRRTADDLAALERSECQSVGLYRVGGESPHRFDGKASKIGRNFCLRATASIAR
jgi:hypothetical protein